MSLILKWNKFLSIFWLFEPIKNRYWMYFYWKKFSELEAFISWFMFVLNNSKLFPSFEQEKNIYLEFHEFIVKKLSNKHWNILSYYRLILLEVGNDEEKAFDLFFELWDEFVKEKGIVFEWDEEKK